MKERSLKQNAILSGIRQLCSVIFPLFTFSYASRVLGVESIGIYSYSSSIISYFVLIAALGTSNYAIRNGAELRNDREKINQFCSEIFTINVASTILSYLLLFVLLLVSENVRAYNLTILILSFTLFANTIGTEWVNAIFEDYAYLALRYIIIQLISFGLLVLFVKDGNDFIKYVVIALGASTFGNIMNIWYRRRYVSIHLVINKRLKKHIIPVLVFFSNSIATVIYLNSDITMLGIICGNGAVGVYTVASKIYTILKALISSTIVVTIPRFTSYLSQNKKKEYNEQLNKLVNILFLIIIPIIVGTIMEAKNIILCLSGEEYLYGIPSLIVLSMTIFFAVYSCLFVYSVLIPQRKEKVFMMSTIASAVVNIMLNFILIPKMGTIAAALTTLISEIIVFAITGLYAIRLVNFKLSICNVYSSCLGGACIVAICYMLNSLNLHYFISMVLAVIISGFTYLVINILINRQMLKELLKLGNKETSK